MSNQDSQDKVLSCQICTHPYNRISHKPLIICQRHHTICRACLNKLPASACCPFCRQKIIFPQIVTNYDIEDLLPHEDVRVNARKEVGERRRNYLEGHYSMNSEEYEGNNGYIPLRRINHQRPFSRNEKNILGVFLFLQIPFAITNLTLALTSPYSPCMNKSQGMSFLIVRPWLLGVGMTQLVLVMVAFLPLIFMRVGCTGYEGVRQVWKILKMLVMLKVLVWAVVELQLFGQVIVHLCSGFILGYGIVLSLAHILLLFGLCFSYRP